MDCKFAEKISALIDGELSPEEISQTRAHLLNCAECRQLEKDFLYFRQQIKDSVFESGSITANERVSSQKTPFWKKRIFLPTPVLALLLLLLVILGVWTLTLNLNRRQETAATAAAHPQKAPPENKINQKSPGEISLSRFDKGRRAEIYTISRQSLNEAEKSESAQ